MENIKTFGLLYPGDMGMAIAIQLIEHQHKVISVSKGRSETTKNNIKNSGIEDVRNLDDLIAKSDFVFSLTTPNSSLQIAEQFAEIAKQHVRKPIFVDLNSNSPEMALKIEKVIQLAGAKFINAAVMGASHDVPKTAVIAVSGAERASLIPFLTPMFNVKDLGENIGSASAYKLLFSMVNKGINALFFETMTAAAHFGVLDDLNESLQNYLPGTYQDLKKTTPTYPQHIHRRISEMQGLATMLETEQLPNGMASASADMFKLVYEGGILKNKRPTTVTEMFEYFKPSK